MPDETPVEQVESQEPEAPSQYFAAQEAQTLIGELNQKVQRYYSWILTTGRLARWRVAFDTYYGQRGRHSSSYITQGGEKGELSFLMSNEYRNLLQHLIIAVSQTRPALEMVTTNTDSKSKAHAYLAKGLVEFYRRNGQMDANALQAIEIALVMDIAWVFNDWDSNQGPELPADPETGEIGRSGDIVSRARTPLDVVFDYTCPDPHLQTWRLVRDTKNKYDLAAAFLDHKEKIEALSRETQDDVLFRFGDLNDYYEGVDESSLIDVWTFYHAKSPAMPQGRVFSYVGNDIPLLDTPLPHDRLPGHRVCPTERILSAMGHSNANDLLGLQDVLDAMVSAATTNITSTGVTNVWVKPGENFDFEQLAPGMNLIESDTKPEPLVLAELPKQWFEMANWIIARMETYSGQNSVARGNTEGKDFSGAAMALLQSMSIQFNSGVQKALNQAYEANGDDVIEFTKKFVPSPRLGEIIGLKNEYMIREYKGDDLSNVKRCYVRQSNALKDTTSGRLTILAEALKLEGGVTRAQFAELLDTGNTDCLLEDDRNLELAIDQENEALMRGEQPPVVFSDNHPQHIQKHRTIFADPEARKDPDLINRAIGHLQEHLTRWGSTPPDILAALGMPPMIMPPMGIGGPTGPGGGIGPETSPGPGGPPNKGVADVLGEGPDKQNLPNQPSQPENPLTGKQWNPEDGGGMPAIGG